MQSAENRLTVGDIEIYLVNDCRIQAEAGGMFGLVPRALWGRFIQPDEHNRIPVDHMCLLVRSGRQAALIDTGYGLKLTDKQVANMGLTRPEGTLEEALARLGLSPQDITLVFNTHLHGDHCGGNTLLVGEQIVPAFPNARYLAQRREFAEALFPNERTRGTYFPENYAPLQHSGQMQLVDGDVDILPGVRGVIAPGHTPAHMIVTFESQGEYGLFLTDLASMSPHFERLAWMTAYDVEPLVTLETKRTWQGWALRHQALLIFQHDPIIRAGRLTQGDGGKLSLEPTLKAPY